MDSLIKFEYNGVYRGGNNFNWTVSGIPRLPSAKGVNITSLGNNKYKVTFNMDHLDTDIRHYDIVFQLIISASYLLAKGKSTIHYMVSGICQILGIHPTTKVLDACPNAAKIWLLKPEVLDTKIHAYSHGVQFATICTLLYSVDIDAAFTVYHETNKFSEPFTSLGTFREIRQALGRLTEEDFKDILTG